MSEELELAIIAMLAEIEENLEEVDEVLTQNSYGNINGGAIGLLSKLVGI